MIQNREFIIREYHLKLLKRLYFGWQDCEFGAPEVDPKRPYGNSDVPGDIAEILEWKLEVDPWGDKSLSDLQEKVAYQIHLEMQTVLNILVRNLDQFGPGTYVSSKYDHDWTPKGCE